MKYSNIKNFLLNLTDKVTNVPTDESEDYVDVHFKPEDKKDNNNFKGF